LSSFLGAYLDYHSYVHVNHWPSVDLKTVFKRKSSMLHEKLIGTKYTNVAQASVTGKIRLAFYNTDLTLLMLKKNTNFMGPCC